MYENKRLLKLLSVLNSALKNNVTEESLEIFKKDLSINFRKLHSVIKKLIPDFSDKHLRLFDEYQIYYASCLFPSISSFNEHRQEFKTVNLTNDISDNFVKRFSEYLEIVILGLRAKDL